LEDEKQQQPQNGPAKVQKCNERVLASNVIVLFWICIIWCCMENNSLKVYLPYWIQIRNLEISY